MRFLPLIAVLSLSGCDLLALLERPEPRCDEHLAAYPDADGDGVGDDAGVIFIGCDVPEGYVTVPPDTDAVPDTDDTDTPADSDVHTDESDVDTDNADTDTDA